jgi:hypothetical protein
MTRAGTLRRELTVRGQKILAPAGSMHERNAGETPSDLRAGSGEQLAPERPLAVHPLYEIRDRVPAPSTSGIWA